MNIFQLECFIAVANCLSFAQAAKQMQISQPAISNQIRTLDEELEGKLFQRSTRMVQITTEGRTFLPDAKTMVATAQQAKLRFQKQDDRVLHALTIGCSTFTQFAMLADQLRLLSKEIPNLHPQLHVVPHEHLLRLLEDGKAEIIFDLKTEDSEYEKFTYRELGRVDLYGVCRKGHPLTEKAQITIDDLATVPLIFCDPIYLVPEIAKLQLQLAAGRSPVDLHFCDSSEAATILAAAGLGVAVLPGLFIPRDDRISLVPLAGTPKLPVGIFYKPYPGDTTLRKFIHIVTEQGKMKRDEPASEIERGVTAHGYGEETELSAP